MASPVLFDLPNTIMKGNCVFPANASRVDCPMPDVPPTNKAVGEGGSVDETRALEAWTDSVATVLWMNGYTCASSKWDKKVPSCIRLEARSLQLNQNLTRKPSIESLNHNPTRRTSCIRDGRSRNSRLPPLASLRYDPQSRFAQGISFHGQ